MAEARASGTKVWNLTALAPASAAASIRRCAIVDVAVVIDARLGDHEDAIEPDLLVPDAERRDVAGSQVRGGDVEVLGFVDVDGAVGRHIDTERHARLDEPPGGPEGVGARDVEAAGQQVARLDRGSGAHAASRRRRVADARRPDGTP